MKSVLGFCCCFCCCCLFCILFVCFVLFCFGFFIIFLKLFLGGFVVVLGGVFYFFIGCFALWDF